MTPIIRCVGTRLLAVLLVLSAAALARADVTYSLVNYPAQQGPGRTLSGSITVVDAAADDGLLQQGEVVRMQFTVTNGTNTTTVDSATTPFAQLSVSGTVRIDATGIRMLYGSNSVIRLLVLPSPGSTNDGEITWIRSCNIPPCTGCSGSSDVYVARDFQGTSSSSDDVTYWSLGGPNLSFGGSMALWTIADRVPPPPTPTGACCNRATGGCLVLTQADCTAFGGTYAGDNITCSAASCTLCLGDLNGDGVVNTADLTRFLGRFGSTCQ